MNDNLGVELHRLVAALDRAAERILRDANALSYRRFVTLLLISELHDPTQRELAKALGISEPSASRMITVLARAGYVEVAQAAQGGNRRRLSLTPAGKDAVERSRDLLEERIASLVSRSGVPHAAYSRHTRALIDALAESEQPTS